MFQLICSARGSIKRKQFLLGLVLVFAIMWLSFFAWSFFSIYMFKHWGVTGDMVVSLKEIAKTAPEKYATIMRYETIFSPIYLGLTMLLVAWFKLCLIIKRLRDMALTPWFIILPALASIAMFENALIMLPHNNFSFNPVNISALVIIVVFFLILLVCPSRIKD